MGTFIVTLNEIVSYSGSKHFTWENFIARVFDSLCGGNQISASGVEDRVEREIELVINCLACGIFCHSSLRKVIPTRSIPGERVQMMN